MMGLDDRDLVADLIGCLDAVPPQYAARWHTLIADQLFLRNLNWKDVGRALSQELSRQ